MTLAFGRETREWQEFYSALGYCINQWSHIDRSLFDCCALCLATTETKAAIVYYSFTSFEFRKKLVAELLEVSLPPDLKKQWDSALAEMSRLIPLRNVIAHQPIRQQGEIVWDMWAEGGPKVHRAEVRLEVNVEEKELLRGKRKPQTILVEDLRQHTKDVAELSKAMGAITKSFRGFVEGAA